MVMKWLKWAGCAALGVLLAACDKNTSLMEKVVDCDKAAGGQMIAGGAKVDERNAYGWTALSPSTTFSIRDVFLSHAASSTHSAAHPAHFNHFMPISLAAHSKSDRILSFFLCCFLFLLLFSAHASLAEEKDSQHVL